MPLIWTNENDEVTKVHNKPNRLADEQKTDAIQVDSVPDPDLPEPYYNTTMYYDEADGFRHEYEDPFAQFGVNVPEEKKVEIYREITSGNFDAVMSTVEELITSK